MITWIVYGFSIVFAVMTFYYSGIKGKLIVTTVLALSIALPVFYPIFVVKQLGFVARIILGIGCLIYLKWRKVI